MKRKFFEIALNRIETEVQGKGFVCRIEFLSNDIKNNLVPRVLLPLSSRTGNEGLWDKAISNHKILVLPV